MSLQLIHALGESAKMLALALVAAYVAFLSGDVDTKGFVIALLVATPPVINRIYEGWQDSIRNEKGDVLNRDVGA